MIYLCYFDESWIELDGLESSIKELRDHFSYEEKGARYSFAAKMGYWNGLQYLINVTKKGIVAPAGLTLKIIKYCIDNSIDFQVDKKLKERYRSATPVEKIYEFLKQFRFFSGQKEIHPRRDQYGATIRLCKMDRGINIAPTGWGKSLAIFMQILWMLNQEDVNKILLIVPTKDLVQQFKNDILNYCTNEQGRREQHYPNIQCLYAGQDKKLAENTQLFISTFQSLNRLDKSFVNNFDVLILDECHRASANTIKQLFQNAYLVKYKYGWTGSLEKDSINLLLAEANIGPSKKIVSTKDLIAEKTLADIKVNRICITHQHKPDIIRKKIEGEDYLKKYQKEQEYFENLPERNEFICNFLSKFEKNCLVFFNHLSHGKILYDMCREKYPNKKVFLIDGTQTLFNCKKYKSFEELKNLIENSDNCILLCSFGRFSTGINLHNLSNMFFVTHNRSYIRIIQSLGRGMRQNGTKDKTLYLYDFYDKWKTGTTFSLKHSESRLELLKEITNNITESGIYL